MSFRSSSAAILLVAWRMKAVEMYSGSMPVPLSLTSISLTPPRLNGNGDLGRTGVDGIFHQLFDHRGRTLHHFARSDQLGGMLIQNADDCHMDILLSCREHTQPERLPLRVFLSS